MCNSILGEERMNKVVKILNFLLILLVSIITIINLFSINSYAYETTKMTKIAAVTDPTQNPNSYKPESNTENTGKFSSKAKVVLGVIRNVGVIASVIILMILGVKYMLGSVEEKANYKQTLLPFLIGAIILLIGSVIPSVIYNFVK